jgi:phosphoribosyl 1,2-cyclic phosphodiesterase
VRTTILGSGSSGNALVLESGDTRILIDAGFPTRILARRLEIAGIAPQSITALVVTHEHHDHARGVAAAIRKWKWRAIATRGTIRACPALMGATVIEASTPCQVGAIEILPVPIPHDANEPVGIVATDRTSGSRVGIAYDLGGLTQTVRSALADLDLLVIEANHDETMLRRGPYPRSVMQRIAGHYGHLSNRAAAELVRSVAKPSLRHVILAHLSERCNEPGLAIATVKAATSRVAWNGSITIAEQHTISVASGADQLSLAF